MSVVHERETIEVPRLFFDADALIAGAASGSGASRVLLKAAEASIVLERVRESPILLSREKSRRRLPTIGGCAARTTALEGQYRGFSNTLQGITSQQAVTEARRNLNDKLPDATRAFESLLAACLRLVPDPDPQTETQLARQAAEDDVPLLASAVECDAHFLVTFNVRHYWPEATRPQPIRPGDLLRAIRAHLTGLAD